MNFRSGDSFAVLCSTILARRLSILFPILIMAGLLFMSSIPGRLTPDDPEIYRIVEWVPPSIQNLMHIPAYALLGFAWRWCLGGWTSSGRATVLALIIAVSFGVAEESYQSMIPGRYASLTDVLFDATGAVLGVWLFHRLHSMYCDP